MEIKLWWSDKIKCTGKLIATRDFMQKMCNRLIQGEVRYGPPRKEQNYMTRMIMEVKAYKRQGNMEQLINIANYAVLESITPENKKFHFDSTVESVTRGKI